MFLAVTNTTVRSALPGRCINGCMRSLWLTGASASKSTMKGISVGKSSLKNQERLEKNRTNGEEMLLSGPAREGLALLQGLLLCGHCGRALTVRYMGNGGIYPCYLCNWLRRDGLAHKDCVNFRCDLLDAAIAEEVLKP